MLLLSIEMGELLCWSRYVVNGKAVQAHLFERTVTFKRHIGDKKSYKMHLQLLVKEHNAQKLDSQLWFFEGIAKHLYLRQREDRVEAHGDPELYTALIDVNGRPRAGSVCMDAVRSHRTRCLQKEVRKTTYTVET